MNDASKKILQQIADAVANNTPLKICGGNSKTFYGNKVDGQTIDLSEHQGITEYHPSELVVTVRSGTKLCDLEAELYSNKQMLGFEPPQHSTETTIGGVIACGLSGPRRATCGSARDFVLGTTIINGKAEKCRFGGQVMKNVAGYDASRLMVGAQGTLGVLLDISIKILPLNETEISLKLKAETNTAIKNIQQWINQGLPITASCFIKDTLYLRLGSTHSAVKQSLATINHVFDAEEIDNTFWLQIKNQTHDFFQDTENLWRCSHQPSTELYGGVNGSTDNQLLEWDGALRWIKQEANLHEIAAGLSGHATRYPLNNTNTEASADIFQPLQPGILKLHKNLKRAFDPKHILNSGRMYSDF